MATGTVYALCDPKTGQVRYVGWTTDPKKRLTRHLANARHGRRSRTYDWLRGLADPPEMVPLEAEVPENLLPARERFWIADLRARGADLLNKGGGGGSRTPAEIREAASKGGTARWAKLTGPQRDEARRVWIDAGVRNTREKWAVMTPDERREAVRPMQAAKHPSTAA